jgi:hypothetical protein
MTFSPELIALGQYLAGEFDNREQALAEPIWYVHLRLWLRPVPLFSEDSIALFAEQASVVNLDSPYRPRLLRLRENPTNPLSLQIEHYMFEDIEFVKGAGRNPDILKQITAESVKFLPNCTLSVKIEPIGSSYQFSAFPNTEDPCTFTYQGKNFQVALGLQVTSEELLTYDRGIDPETGKAIWGAIIGPYRYRKRQDFASELSYC